MNSKHLGKGSPKLSNKKPLQTPTYQSTGSHSERSKMLQGIQSLTPFKLIAPDSVATSASTSIGMTTVQGGRLLKQQSQNQSTAMHIKVRAFIKIFYSKERFMYIALFDENDEEDPQDLTSGWLLSETIRMFNQIQSHQQTGLEHQIPISLSTLENQSECIDFYLTQMHQPLIKFLTFSQELQTDIIIADQELIMNFVSKKELNLYETKNLRQKMEIPTLRDYDLLKVLGTGGFSQVLLVRRRVTGKMYAMKVINKKHIVDSDKVDQIISERKIFSMLNHPFIVQLHSAFTSVRLSSNLFNQKNYLFLVLDLCPGGELFYYISKIKKFPESQAKVIFAEILLTIEHLHKKNILYRDLKPENILIDEQGHIKLTDFGLSKMDFGEQDLSMTFCGSPEYMCPEMLTQRGHNFKLDIYCLGVLLFELLTGLPPHYSQNRIGMYQDIVNTAENYPQSMSKEVKSLLKGMLQKNPDKRMSIKEIKEHKFCQDIDWEKLFRKEVDPPILVDPRISNFEQEYTQMEIKISLMHEEELVVQQRFPQTEATRVNRLRKTKSSEYLDTYERIQTEHSKEKPKKSIKKPMRTQKNAMKRKLKGHLTTKNLFGANQETLQSEDFTSEIKQSKLDRASSRPLLLQPDDTIKSRKMLIDKEVTPTFQEFLYRRQTLNRLIVSDQTMGTEVYSPRDCDSRNSFAFKVMLEDKIEMFNPNSNNPSILTEQADNMQINIQTMHQFNDQITKNLSQYAQHTSNNYQQRKNPRVSKINLKQTRQKGNNEADLEDSVIEEENRVEDDDNSVSSRMKSMIGNVRIELPQKSESQVEQDVEMLQDDEDDEVVEFHFERVDSIKSEDHTPMYKKLSNNMSKLIEENFYYYKNSETMHTEEGNINDSNIVGRKSLNTMSPNMREQKVQPQRGTLYRHMTSLQINNYKSEIEEIRDLLHSSLKQTGKQRQSENLLMMSEKMNGIFSERRRESNLVSKMSSILEEEAMSPKADSVSQRHALQPVHKPSTFKCQQKDQMASTKQLGSEQKKSPKKNDTKFISQFTQQVNLHSKPQTSILAKSPKTSPMRKLRSQESFLPQMQFKTQEGGFSRQPSNIRKQNSTATSLNRRNQQTSELRSNSQVKSVIQSGQVSQQSMMTSLKKKSNDVSQGVHNFKQYSTQDFKKPKKNAKNLLHCQTQNESIQLSDTFTNQSNSQLGLPSNKSRNINLKQTRSSNMQSNTQGSVKNGSGHILLPHSTYAKPSTSKGKNVSGERSPSGIKQPTIFNFKVKDSQLQESLMQQSQIQSEQESFLSNFRTNENRSCRPSLAKQKMSLKESDAIIFNNLQSQTFSENIKALSKKLSLKNSAQQASQWEEIKDSGFLNGRQKPVLKKATSNDRVNSQQRRLHSTINSQLSMQNTLNKHKKPSKPIEKVQLQQSQQSKIQTQKDVKITNKTYLRKLNSHQQNQTMNSKESIIQELGTAAPQIVHQAQLSKNVSLQSKPLVQAQGVQVANVSLEQKNSPTVKNRKSKISDGFGDSVTEFEVESSISMSLFRQTPSLVMVEEITPRQKVMSPNIVCATIKEQVSTTSKQSSSRQAQSPKDSKKDRKITGSGGNLQQTLYKSMKKKQDVSQQSNTNTSLSAKHQLFGRRKTQQEIETLMPFSTIQSLDNQLSLKNKDNQMISINLRHVPIQSAQLSQVSSIKLINQDEANKQLSIKVNEHFAAEYQHVKPKSNGNKLFGMDNSKQNSKRLFSPPTESSSAHKQKKVEGLLHNEIDKYQTKLGKKIKDLDGYSSHTYTNPNDYGQGNNSIHNQSQTAAQISFDNYNQPSLSQNYKDLTSSYSLSATKKPSQESFT